MNKTSIDAMTIWVALRSRWYICLASVLICLSVALYYVSFKMEPMYSASTTIFLSNDAADAERANATNVTIAEKLKEDCQVLITSDRVLDTAQRTLPADVDIRLAKISVSSVEESRIVKLSITYPNAENAANIANAITESLITEAKAITKIENIQFVDRATVPEGPLTGRSRNFVLVALVFGFAVGFGIVLLIEVLDKKLHSASDIPALFDLPVLASIPKITEKDIIKDDTTTKDGES